MEKVDLYDYPTRFQNALGKVTQSDKICEENKKDIVAFSKVKLAKGCSYGRVAKVVYYLDSVDERYIWAPLDTRYNGTTNSNGSVELRLNPGIYTVIAINTDDWTYAKIEKENITGSERVLQLEMKSVLENPTDSLVILDHIPETNTIYVLIKLFFVGGSIYSVIIFTRAYHMLNLG